LIIINNPRKFCIGATCGRHSAASTLCRQLFDRTVESEHQFEAAVAVGRDPVRFPAFPLPGSGQRRRQQGKTRGKTGNNSHVLTPMPALKPSIWSVVAHSHRRLVDEGRRAQRPRLRHSASRILRRGQRRRNLGNERRVRPGAAGLGYLIGCSEMGLKVRWSFMALLAVVIVALPGCASTGPLAGDPCWGFFVCTGWH
jgi:hypothetical protein